VIPMLRKTLWELRWTATWYGVVAVVYVALILAYFPYVRSNTATLSKLMASYPKALIQAFGVTDLGTYSGFLGTEVFNVIWPILMAAFAIAAGSAVVAKEVEDGTVELWLSVPAGRVRLLGGKLLALGAATLLLVVVSLAPVVVAAPLVGASVSATGVAAMGAVMAGFVLTVAAYSALFSAFSADRGRAAGIAGGLTLAFYLAWVVSRMSDTWSWLGKLSIFSAYDPQRALATGTVDPVQLGVLAALIALCTALALVGFQRRDAIA
jgi:ABC-2 type transport system permease protein